MNAHDDPHEPEGILGMTTAWENKILTYKLAWKGFDYAQMEQDLNDYGREGWEVVQTIIPALGAGQTLEIAVVIKRPAVG